MADSATINSPDYWNHRFAEDWTARGGAEQTSFFAGLAISMLPDWFWADAIANELSLVDVGCALGEALPSFQKRLPRSKLTGIDVSKVAIRMARERLPDFTFRAVKQDWSDAPRGDIMFCSNTLEHLKNWKKRLARLSELSDKYVLMLVPFQEVALIEEHVVNFDFTSFPAALPDGRRLLYFRILDAAQTQGTHWQGHQALAVYGSKSAAKKRAEVSNDPYLGVDFRGRSSTHIKAALLALQAAYPGKGPKSAADAQQALVDRINAEWAQKLDASLSEMNAKQAELRAHYEKVLAERDASREDVVAGLVAKHGELKAHYERLLGERDARIGQLAEVQAWRQRAQQLEDALRETLTQQLKRSEAQVAALSEQASQARVEAAQAKADAAQAERLAQQTAALEQEKHRFALAEIARELDVVRARAAQDVAATERKAQANAEALTNARADAAQRIAAVERSRAALEAEATEIKTALEQLRSDGERARSEAAQALAALEAQVSQAKLALEQARAEADRARGDAAQALAQLQVAQVEAEEVRAEALQLRADAETVAALQQSIAAAAAPEELTATRTALAAREQEIEALKADVKRATADHQALKAAVTAAVDERDEARANQGGRVPAGRLQAVEAELEEAKRAVERAEHARDQAAAAHTTVMRELVAGFDQAAAAHTTVIRELVAGLDPALAALRRAWQGDYARLSGRAALLEQHSQDLRAQLMRILGSKSLKLGTSLRGIYWTLRGQPGAPGETTPPDVPIAHDPGSEFLRLWDTAKRSVDGARRAAEATPSSPVVAPATSAPATHVQTEKPPPAVAPTPPPPLTVSPRQGGRVIALQAASLGNGGLERVVFDLAIGLKARGEKVIVVCVQSGGIFADELLQRGITVHEVNRDVSRFESVLRDEGVTDLFAHHSYFGYERAASLGVRLYDVVHNYYFWHRGSGNMIRRVADLSAGVVYVSAAVRSFHERLFGVAVNKGIVINNPVHIDGLIVPEKPQLQRLREKSSETIFLNVAQAFPSKAQPALITAFARALRKNRAMKLRIAGAAVKEEAARAVRARIEDEGVGNAVELLGHCDRRKMSKLYAEAHAFVLPSLYEGYSVSAIEAATYSLPLILTNVGGAEDLIAKSGCGILLPSATDDLAKLDPPAVEKLGLESENAATSALEKAFLTIAGERPQWTARGLAAHYDIRSLDDVIDAYLALMPATARASA